MRKSLMKFVNKGSDFEKTSKEPKKKSVKPSAAPVFTRKEIATIAQ
jgi:hypothetical protein